ncbi:unnamed protein product [Parnassius apollo]|uniref:(apollo) hypothetical protein n=1 Tax=Parnassius apollo TaxID=110799 RepID=A0A8S3XND0_PARAO|nr:unnamed protein product [Parnassius apollo]
MSDHQPGTSRGTKRSNEIPLRAQSNRVLLHESDILEALGNSGEDDFVGSDDDEDFYWVMMIETAQSWSPKKMKELYHRYHLVKLNETIEESAMPHVLNLPPKDQPHTRVLLARL